MVYEKDKERKGKEFQIRKPHQIRKGMHESKRAGDQFFGR